MSTEILGYMKAPTREYKPVIKPKRNKEAVKNRLLGAVLIVLGAVTIPLENDATAFVMCLLLGVAAMIGSRSEFS